RVLIVLDASHDSRMLFRDRMRHALRLCQPRGHGLVADVYEVRASPADLTAGQLDLAPLAGRPGHDDLRAVIEKRQATIGRIGSGADGNSVAMNLSGAPHGGRFDDGLRWIGNNEPVTIDEDSIRRYVIRLCDIPDGNVEL